MADQARSQRTSTKNRFLVARSTLVAAHAGERQRVLSADGRTRRLTRRDHVSGRGLPPSLWNLGARVRSGKRRARWTVEPGEVSHATRRNASLLLGSLAVTGTDAYSGRSDGGPSGRPSTDVRRTPEGTSRYR